MGANTSCNRCPEVAKGRVWNVDVRSVAWESEVCIVAWALDEQECNQLNAPRLLAFHTVLSVFATEQHAYTLERGATFGILACREPADNHGFPGHDPTRSMEDVAVRFGQKLGQWAMEQKDPFGLLVGVHTGRIELLKLVNTSSIVFYGEAITVARQLADTCPQRGCVHLLKSTKDSLRALECLQFSLNPTVDSFYVEPSAEAPKATGIFGSIPHTNGNAGVASHSVSNDKADSMDENNADVSPEVVELMALLKENKIDVRLFSKGALGELYKEVYIDRHSGLERIDGDLQRTVHLAKVWVCADILTAEHVLISKVKVQGGRVDNSIADKPVTMRMPPDLDWEEGCKLALQEKLGLDQSFQAAHFRLDEKSYKKSQEIAYSKSYPGLKTRYDIHEVAFHIMHEQDPALNFLGLPTGDDYVRLVETKTSSYTVSWGWRPASEVWNPQTASAAEGRVLKRDSSATWNCAPKRRLPAPSPLPFPDGLAKPKCMVKELMLGRNPDWARARRAAKSIRSSSYTLREFYEDVLAAFPELALYVSTGCNGQQGTVSGNTADDEYQRTMGALFAVFWMMRLHLDGALSFCFGVSDQWKPLSSKSSRPVRTSEEKIKRQTAMENMQWDKMEQLLVDAGLLLQDRPPGAGAKVIGHDDERTLAMLVLTAVHDIMKISALVPVVQAEHAPFRGYKAGEVIGDHDVALAYVLECFDTALPSFVQLDVASRAVVKFTQSKMDYNMGWLVQAEATPGALFSSFKETIMSGNFSDRDVAFYFVHWLTDLAGTEPCPQEGCEKFVLKFPRKVLISFLQSFPIIKELAVKTETEVFESYLAWRWRTHEPSLGPVPEGPGAVARQRLIVMAQGDSASLLEEFEDLHQAYVDILSQELARTGCSGQVFSQDPVPGGPAIMIYYGPALLQQAGSNDMGGALFLLAELYGYARELFPIRPGAEDETVCVRIDALKSLQVTEIRILQTPGEVWILERTGSFEAQVRRKNLLREGGIDTDMERALFTGDLQDGPAMDPTSSMTSGSVHGQPIKRAPALTRSPRRRSLLNDAPTLRRRRRQTIKLV